MVDLMISMIKFLISKLAVLFKIIPTNYKLILLESNPTFSDNTKKIYETMLKESLHLKYNIIWISFDGKRINDLPNTVKQKNVYIQKSTSVFNVLELIKLNILYSRARYIFYTHNNRLAFKPKKDQYVINLTHGVPLKDSSGRHSSTKYMTHIVTTSEYSGKLRIKTYDGGYEKLIITGYPRNDYFFEDYKLTKQDRLIFWLPTYRKHKEAKEHNNFDELPLNLDSVKMGKLNEFLIKANYRLYIKPHPAQKLKESSMKSFSNIAIIDDGYLMQENIHLYELLNKTDVLITDYSSVYIDFLLKNKPIIFTVDDIKTYQEEWGFTVKDINLHTPGYKVYDFDSLIAVLNTILIDREDPYVLEREICKEKFHLYEDANSSYRILEEVELL